MMMVMTVGVYGSLNSPTHCPRRVGHKVFPFGVVYLCQYVVDLAGSA